jgi:hypothetical protein
MVANVWLLLLLLLTIDDVYACVGRGAGKDGAGVAIASAFSNSIISCLF